MESWSSVRVRPLSCLRLNACVNEESGVEVGRGESRVAGGVRRVRRASMERRKPREWNGGGGRAGSDVLRFNERRQGSRCWRSESHKGAWRVLIGWRGPAFICEAHSDLVLPRRNELQAALILGHRWNVDRTCVQMAPAALYSCFVVVVGRRPGSPLRLGVAGWQSGEGNTRGQPTIHLLSPSLNPPSLFSLFRFTRRSHGLLQESAIQGEEVVDV